MKNKIFTNINMPPSKKKLTLEQIYKDFGLRYDVREARKLMDLPINTPKQEVNSLLKNYWREIEDEINPYVYVYTLSGTTQTPYSKKDPKDPKKLIQVLSNPTQISITFQTKQNLKVPMRKFAIHNIEPASLVRLPPNVSLSDYFDAIQFLNNEKAIDKFLQQGEGSHKLQIFQTLSRQRLRKIDADIRTTEMYKCIINLPYKEFNGFRDSGNSMCVPETILHHLKLGGRNKKLTIDKVIDTLESNIEEDVDIKYNIEYKFNEDELEGDYECPDEFTDVGQRGYTPEELIKTLEHYKCRGKLLDINQKEFISTNNFEGKKYNNHLKTFVGICYGNHLYYCHDEHFVKSISAKSVFEKSESFFEFDSYVKNKDFEDKREYEVIETNDLTDLYVDMFEKDKTLKKVKLQDGKIVSMIYGDKVICANPEKSIMVEMLGDDFKNENTTMIGIKEFNKYFENIELKMSNFNKEVFDNIHKHGNIVKTLNAPQ